MRSGLAYDRMRCGPKRHSSPASSGAHSRPSGAMTRICTPGERRPSVVLSCSSVSSSDGPVATGNSVRPQLEHTPRPPSTSCTSRWSSGEFGRAPADARTQPREQLFGTVLALRGHVRLEERKRAPEEGGVVLGHHERASFRVEDGDHHEPQAGEQRRGDDRDAADVRDRERHRIHVVRCRRVAGDEPVRAGHHRRVGVPHALRVTGRSRRVVQPARRQRRTRRRLRWRRRAASTGSALGNASSQSRISKPCDSVIVSSIAWWLKPAERAGCDDEIGLRLAGDVGDLTLPHDRDDRVLHRVEARRAPP